MVYDNQISSRTKLKRKCIEVNLFATTVEEGIIYELAPLLAQKMSLAGRKNVATRIVRCVDTLSVTELQKINVRHITTTTVVLIMEKPVRGDREREAESRK